MDRKKQVMDRLIETVREYNVAFSAPCPMHILSAHYSRACVEFGGFPECIAELKAENRINVFLIKSGGRVCVVVGVDLIPENAVKV